MKIHEYQAKQIMKMYGISVPNGSPAFSAQRQPCFQSGRSGPHRQRF